MNQPQLEDYHFNPQLWPAKTASNPREIDLLISVAREYGLSPVLKEITLLRGNVLITAAGLQKIAVSHPDYDGLEINYIVTDWENDFYVIEAQVYKKGCAHPFVDCGDADKNTSQMKGRALFRHAITRARSRAIKTAFGIPLLTLEELADDDIKKEKHHPREVAQRPLNLPSHRAERSRDDHPTTMELDAPKTGQAPRTPLPGEAIPVRKSKDPNAHYHATCEDLGFSPDERRWLLGYPSTIKASDQEKDALAYALKEWDEQEVEAARTFVNSESLDDLRANFGKLTSRQKTALAQSKDYLKQVLSEEAA